MSSDYTYCKQIILRKQFLQNNFTKNEISDSFFSSSTESDWSFHYPGYVKRLQKEQQKQAREKKIAQKILCEEIGTKTMSQTITY